MELSYKELLERGMYIDQLSNGKIKFSVQYGMCFLLSPEGEIILSLNSLLSEEGLEEAKLK